MSINTTNKSINFQSDRGNDIYREREVIRIKLDAGSAPLINTSDSYLTFSMKMGANGAYTIPDEKLGSCPWETIQIYDGTETTLLEQMDNVAQWTCMKNYYGNNANDDQLQSIYEGRGKRINDEFVSIGAGANQRLFATSGNGLNPNRGGGFGSQYYQLDGNDMNSAKARKSQIIYRFPMSGLLSSMKTELLPLVVLNGLVIKLTLIEGAKLLRLQQVRADIVGQAKADLTRTLIGYGVVNAQGQQTFENQAPANQNLYLASPQVYSIHGYIDAAGAEQIANIPDATNILGLILRKSTDAPDGRGLDDIRNCSIPVGGRVAVGVNVAAANVAGAALEIPRDIVSVTKGGADRIVVRWAANYQTGAVGDPTRANRWVDANNPVVCSVQNLKTDYEVSDLQMVCNVAQTPPEYIQTMIQQAASGKLRLQFNSYQDNRVNIPTGALSNEIFIPTDLQRVYTILASAEVLQSHSLFTDGFLPAKDNLFNYQWIIDGTNTPNIPVSLTRLANNRVSPLQIIELEKALDESSIRIRNIQNPHKFPVIGRRMGAYGDSVSLLEKNLKCRINYQTQQPQNLLWHFWIYHTKSIMFEGGARVIVE